MAVNVLITCLITYVEVLPHKLTHKLHTSIL